MSPRWLDVDALTPEELLAIQLTADKAGVETQQLLRELAAEHAAARPAPSAAAIAAAFKKACDRVDRVFELPTRGFQSAGFAAILIDLRDDIVAAYGRVDFGATEEAPHE